MNNNLKDGKNNQPIYQKIWFWVLIILALFVLIGGAYGIGKSSNNSNNAKTEQKSESKPTDESNNTDDEKIYMYLTRDLLRHLQAKPLG